MASRSKRSIVSDARAVLDSYNINAETELTTSTTTVDDVQFTNAKKLAQHVVKLMRSVNTNRRYTEWKNLDLAGRVLKPSKQDIDLATSFLWLHVGSLSSTGVRNVLAAQEGCLITRMHPACRNQDNSTACRKCSDPKETIEHVISCCSHWLRTLYIDRHDSVARNLYYLICRKYDLQPPHYTQKVDCVKENDSVKLYWSQPVQTRAIVKHNKPDIIVFDKNQKTATILEVAVSWFTGLKHQVEIKTNRYTVNGNYTQELEPPYPGGANLASELGSQGWKVTFVPVVIGATGEVLSCLKGQLESSLNLNNKAALKLIERLQRSAILGTSRIVKNHLST